MCLNISVSIINLGLLVGSCKCLAVLNADINGLAVVALVKELLAVLGGAWDHEGLAVALLLER